MSTNMSNYTNMKCLCGWYEIYDEDGTNLYVYDPESSSYMEKNGEIKGLVDDPNQKDDTFVFMDEFYETGESDTEDTESTQVLFDVYERLSGEQEEYDLDELVDMFDNMHISEM